MSRWLPAASFLALVLACSSQGSQAGAGGVGCLDGEACTPVDACHQGRRDCGAGVCADSGEPLADGTACGEGQRCGAGVCLAGCLPGVACQPASPCATGATVCATPTALASCQAVGARPDGAACGLADVCSAGACVPPACVPGDACQPADPCRIGVMACTSATQPGTCPASGAKGDGVACGSGLVCLTGACVAATSPLGGTVAGLLGSGLVLSNGRGEHLAVAKAGPFLFNDGLASGDAFQVAIETQPQRPAQDCRVVQGTGTGVAGSTDAPSVLIACVAPRPPPFFHVCDEASCGGQLPVVLRVCPTAEPGCTPSRSTVVVARLDGSRIDAHLLFLNTSPGTPPSSLLVDSGSAVASVRWITVLGAPEVRVESDVDLTFTYYDVAPAWGGTTLIDFVSETSTGSAVDTSFYRHASLEARTAAADLQARAAATVEVERRIAALGSVASAHVAAYFIPSEMATQGEGNFSFGGGLVTVNYGNPGWLAIVGGLVPYASGEFAHEHAHELFLGIQPPYQGGSSCQNEGMADALAYVAGDLPLSNFGPVGLRGLDFEADGCLAMSEMHDVGNCPLWHVLKQGQLTEEFMRGLYHPQHAYSFDSCTLADRRSGDSLLVMYTEAAGGADVRPALDAAGIPHAPTYAESLTALGF